MAYTNKAVPGKTLSVRVGRPKYLKSDTSTRPDSAKGTTQDRRFVRKGREAYVNVKGRKS